MQTSLQVISYPKSGRTWLRVMLDEAGIVASYTHLGWSHQGARRPDELTIELDPRFARHVALFRDPRDTVVSGYHQATARLRKYSGPVSAFIRDPRHGIEKTIAFNLGLAALCAGRPDSLVLTYEDMLASPAAGLRAVAQLVGHDLDAPTAARIAENNEFERMQARERAGEYNARYGAAFGSHADTPAVALKVCRGVAGGYRDELSPADVDYVDGLLARANYFERMAAFLG